MSHILKSKQLIEFSILSKVISRCIANLVKFPVTFIIEIGKAVLNFDFPDCSVLRNLPAIAGDTGSFRDL